jgi:hypothetical protein
MLGRETRRKKVEGMSITLKGFLSLNPYRMEEEG